jgi:signal transduction histidine kinase/ligand-binding sensor domain-containing protein
MSLKPLFLFFACFIFSGCWLSSRPLPLPAQDGEFSRPAQKPLKLSAPKKFKWNMVHSDSIGPGHISPFDISKLPSTPFNPGGFKVFSKPAIQKVFEYNALPDTSFSLENIPSEPILFKTTLLGTLKKTTFSIPKVRAESYYTSFQYSDDQGLPSPNVQSTLHTRDGIFWIATSEGLCMARGESMQIIPFNYGTIFDMAEDQQGRVWLRTLEYGIFVIDRKTGIQQQAIIPPGIQLRIDKKGFIWVCSFRRGLYIISPDQKTFKHLTNKNGLSGINTIRTLEDRDGRIWISSGGNGIDIFDPSAKKMKRLGAAQGLSGNNILSMTENNEGEIFTAGSRHGIDIINIRKETMRHVDTAQGIKKSQIFNMLEDDEGRMWIGTDSNGVYLLNKNKDSIAHIGSKEGLGDDATWFIDKDDQHQMIVGTFSGGMNVFPAAGRIAHHISKQDGLISNDVWGFFEDSKQRLWIGTYNGINIITPDQKIVQLILNPGGSSRAEAIIQTGPDQFATAGFGSGLFLIDESKHTIEKIGLKEGLPSINILSIYQDKEGKLWLGSVDAGVILFDPQKRTIRHINQASGLSHNRADGITEDSSGKFWISTFGGVDQLDLDSSTIRNYSTKEGLSNDVTVMIFKDKKNRIWLPTERGLNLLDPAKQTNTIFTIPSGLPANGIYSMLEKDGRIYAGTGKGLTELEEGTRNVDGSIETYWKLHTYARPQGFTFLDFNGNAAAITGTDDFWWGIVQGITQMNKSVIKQDSIQAAIQVNGIDILGKSQYFIDPAYIRNVDTLWSENKDTFYLKGTFGTLNTDKQKGIEWDSLNMNYFPVNLSLPPDRNYLRFHFSSSLPQFSGDYSYRYILDGVDESWSTVTDQPLSENYNNISPGYYTFRVSVKKGGGAWSEPSVYHFRIRPPWWKSWWAELIYVLLFISALRLWVRYRSRRLLKENARLEQKVTERTTELSNSLENLRQAQGQLIQAEKMASLGELTAGIAHEIQNPLNFVNNFSEVNTELLEDVNKALDEGDVPEAKELLKDVEMNMGKITFHGKRADAIVKGMLLHSRASSGQKIPTDVNALADEYLRLSYHGLRAKDKSFNAQFTMDFDEKTGQVMLVQQDIGRVLLNLFNNAFYSVTEKKKQLPEGYQPTVSVSTKRKKDSIEIRVRDNGQGIPQKVIDKIYQPFFTTKPAGQGTGLGLSLSYDIITKEHSGKIDVVTKENEFTEFIIELPAQTAA